MSKTGLGTFINVVAVSIALVASIACSALIYFISTNLTHKMARETSLEVADAAMSCVYSLMSQGLNQEDFEEKVRSVCHTSPHIVGSVSRHYTIEVWGGGKLRSEAKAKLPLVRAAFTENRIISKMSGDFLEVAYPARAQTACLTCHTGVAEGDALGVVAIRHDLQEEMEHPRQVALITGLLFVSVGVIAALLAGRAVTRRFSRSLLQVEQKFSRLTQNQEGEAEDLLEFKEVAALYQQVLDQLDRATSSLRLHGKGLAALMLTGEDAPDWLREMERIIPKLHRVIPFPALALIFRRPEADPELHIWWSQDPSAEACRALEMQVREMLGGTKATAEEVPVSRFIRVVHQGEAGDSKVNPEAWISRFLDRSAVGGVIGAAFLPAPGSENNATLTDFLDPLINTVGALRALDDHTRRLEHQATRDPLTGLFNKRAFWDLLAYDLHRAERRNAPLSLLVLDFDAFKLINDTWGHDFGDDFLRAAASHLRAELRNSDMLARTGGDEFAIMTFGSDTQQAFLVAGRLVKAFESFRITAPDGNPAVSTISVGIAVHPDHANTAEQLYRLADAQMYKAKAAGRNRVSLPAAADLADASHPDSERLTLVRRALEEDLIVPFFQPIVDVQTGEVVAHEVLMRILDGDRIVPAGEIVELAETVGLITTMDLKVIEQALEAARKQDYAGRLFINLSPKALVYESFMKTVVNRVESCGIDPGRIIFELTERDTVRNVSLLESFIRDLQASGFGFAIDDFGAGFSSLQYLRRLPIEVLKIDGEFVRHIADDGTDRAIVSAVATLARGLKIQTVAEFVEDAETLEILRELGVDLGQGWHLGKPSPEFMTS